MTEFLRYLTSVPSRQQNSTDISDETYDRQIRDLISYLKQSGQVASSPDASLHLDNIDPSIHTLSFLYLLHFQIQSVQLTSKNNLPEDVKPGGRLWTQAVKFLKSFDPIQVRYAGHEWTQLVDLVGRATLAASKPLLAVKLIRESLIRLDSSSGIFTSVHLLFVKLSLLSRAYSYALPLLDRVLCHFPTDADQTYHNHLDSFLCSVNGSSATFLTDASGFSSKLSYRDHLQYFLYSAMIYMALKKWDKALHCLNIVISCPTSGSVSKIMVEAYKKWLIVSVLAHGKLGLPSKTIPTHVMRVFKALAKPYFSLVDAFEQGNLQRMMAEIDLGQAIWRVDNNTGLVSQLFAAFDRFMILKLGRTFSALTMVDVERRASASSKHPREMEDYVASLVMSKNLYATLSHLPGPENPVMLRFSLKPRFHCYREDYIRAQLIQGGRALSTIAERTRQSNDTLELCPENFQYLAKSQKWASNAGKSGGITSNSTGGGLDIDEDLMGDCQ